mgnify:FL=1
MTHIEMRAHAKSCEPAKVLAALGMLPKPDPWRRISVTFPRISNRQRQRNANLALQHAANAKMITVAILAQKGGEIIVTKGTIEQVTPDMDFEVIINPADENERIVRIVKGAVA